MKKTNSSTALIISSSLPDLTDIIGSIQQSTPYLVYDENSSLMELTQRIIIFFSTQIYNRVGWMSHGAPGKIQLTKKIALTHQSLKDQRIKKIIYLIRNHIHKNGSFDLISCHTGQGEKGENLLQELIDITQKSVFSSSEKIGKDHWTLESAHQLCHLQDIYFTSQINSWNHSLLLTTTAPNIPTNASYFDGVSTQMVLSSCGNFGDATSSISIDLQLYPPIVPSHYTSLGIVRNEWQTIFEVGFSQTTAMYALDWDPLWQYLQIRQGPPTAPTFTAIYPVTFGAPLTTAGAICNLIWANLTTQTLTSTGCTIGGLFSTSGIYTPTLANFPSIYLGRSAKKDTPQFFFGLINNLKIDENGTLLGYWSWQLSGNFGGLTLATPSNLSPIIPAYSSNYQTSGTFSPDISFISRRLNILYSLITQKPTLTRLDNNNNLISVADPLAPEFRIAFDIAVNLNRLCYTGGSLLNYLTSPNLYDQGAQQILGLLCTTICSAIPLFGTLGAFNDTTTTTPNFPNILANHPANTSLSTTMQALYTPRGTDTYSLLITQSLIYIDLFYTILTNSTELSPLGTSQKINFHALNSLYTSIPSLMDNIQATFNGQITLLNEQLSFIKKAIGQLNRWTTALSTTQYALNRRGELSISLQTTNYSIPSLGDEWVCTASDLRLRRIHIPLYAYCLLMANNASPNFNSILGFDLMASQAELYSVYQELTAIANESFSTMPTLYNVLNNILTDPHLNTQYPPTTSLQNAIAAYSPTVTDDPTTLTTLNISLPNLYCNPLTTINGNGWSTTGLTQTLYLFPSNQDGSVGASLIPWTALTSAQATANALKTITSQFDAATNVTAATYYNRFYWTIKLFEMPTLRSNLASGIKSLNSLNEQLKTDIMKETADYQDRVTMISKLVGRIQTFTGTICGNFS